MRPWCTDRFCGHHHCNRHHSHCGGRHHRSHYYRHHNAHCRHTPNRAVEAKLVLRRVPRPRTVWWPVILLVAGRQRRGICLAVRFWHCPVSLFQRWHGKRCPPPPTTRRDAPVCISARGRIKIIMITCIACVARGAAWQWRWLRYHYRVQQRKQLCMYTCVYMCLCVVCADDSSRLHLEEKKSHHRRHKRMLAQSLDTRRRTCMLFCAGAEQL